MKAKKMLIGLILASYALSIAHPILAAPFCAVSSHSGHCWYYTYAECLRATGTDGYCAVNSAEIRQPSVVSQFCVVSPSGGATQCWYSDVKLCRDDAAASGGVCLSSFRNVATPPQGNGATSTEGTEATPPPGTVATPPAGNGVPVIPGVNAPPSLR